MFFLVDFALKVIKLSEDTTVRLQVSTIILNKFLFLSIKSVPTDTNKYFCAVYDYVGKADLSKGYGNP